MTLKQGDLVEVEGKQARIECTWGQGKHLVFRLSDGREFFDLHKGIEMGTVKLIQDEAPSSIVKKVQFPGSTPKKAGEDDDQLI